MTDAIVIVVGLWPGWSRPRRLVSRRQRVVVIEQESRENLGGQAYWSFGGLFLVDSPEQRRMGSRDSLELAWSDWEGTAGFDRGGSDALGSDCVWAAQWARSYVEFAAGEKRSWLAEHGVRSSRSSGGPSAATAPRRARQLGAEVPRHVGDRAGGLRAVRPPGQGTRGRRAAALRLPASGRRSGAHRRVVTGMRGTRLAPTHGRRGAWRPIATRWGSSRREAPVIVITSGGIGANHDLVRANWPSRLGRRR
jgi:predicted oxidoreductase